MNVLQIDIGNTQAKYRCLVNDEVIDQGVCAVNGLVVVLESFRAERVLVASVGTEKVRSGVQKMLEAVDIDDVFWAQTEPAFGPLLNAYTEYSALGVDRWLAIIGAWYTFKRACCVFDFGSAVTVDFVSSEGRHSGGYIVPGSGLCFASLSQNTAALNPDTIISRSEAPGTSTDLCIQNGIYLLQAGFVSAVTDLLSDEYIVCTGGGFSQVAARFDNLDFCYEPDLVFIGLGIVADHYYSKKEAY